ncbi:hypothetical protein RFI_13228 [Reticulomyxa filosa]|uniref:RING-type E3 ubiquitin transferase n=1 Tax=Reticulomyxa filosa TaxID=46433 RepID=X6NF25_RETFI|nr:hypothetical protein RFI_13228 [Reticulomyxa filosa]|eukprot:ETO23932.1 hypothetical protein RFI_13228 [Reticulomyxa filosa]
MENVINVRELLENSSSDWCFSFLEDLLKCPICQELFQTAMILPCSHNFCSLCIRRYLLTESKCPICKHKVTSSQLLCNRVIDQIIVKHKNLESNSVSNANFDKVDQKRMKRTYVEMLAEHEKQKNETGAKEQKGEEEEEEEKEEMTIKHNSKRQKIIKSNGDETTGNGDCNESLPFKKPKLQKKKIEQSVKANVESKNCFKSQVLCPICQQKISNVFVNTHIDQCLIQNNGDSCKNKDPSASATKLIGTSQAPTQESSTSLPWSCRDNRQ